MQNTRTRLHQELGRRPTDAEVLLTQDLGRMMDTTIKDAARLIEGTLIRTRYFDPSLATRQRPARRRKRVIRALR